MRVSDRRHAGAHAEGQGRGLRGRRATRPRRLALSRPLATLLFVALALAGSGPAAGHSLLIESTPAAGANLTAPPRELVLRFNNRIEKKLSKVRLVGVNGERLD